MILIRLKSNAEEILTEELVFDRGVVRSGRSGMGAYAVAARRRVHLATVLLRPRLAIAQADASTAMPVSFRWDST